MDARRCGIDAMFEREVEKRRSGTLKFGWNRGRVAFRLRDVESPMSVGRISLVPPSAHVSAQDTITDLELAKRGGYRN